MRISHSRAIRLALATLASLLFGSVSLAAEQTPVLNQDPHYTPIGFFDIHICNWPDRKPFYMVLFSSTEFEKINAISVLDTNGRLLGNLDMNRFQTIRSPGKPEKRVFITHMELPSQSRDGWFSAVAKTRDGGEYTARDFVVHTLLPIADGLEPRADAQLAESPKELKWNSIPGAKYYKVTIRDGWNNDEVVFASSLLTEPRVAIPAGKLTRGGLYSWRVHARDVDTSTLLGDFNHGSLTGPTRFSINPD